MKQNKLIKHAAVAAALLIVSCTRMDVFASEGYEPDLPNWMVEDEPEVIADDGVEYPEAEEDYAQQFVDTYGPMYDAASQIPYIQAKGSDKMVYYEYDQDGNRISAVSGDEYIKLRFSEDFNWGPAVVGQEKNGVALTFFYDEFERCIGIEYDGRHYDLQYDETGSVSGIENESHEAIAKYEYDENNNCKVYGKDENGEWTEDIDDPGFIGLQNPFRWNGSYYDALSGYYMSRDSACFDVQTGDWIRDESILAQIR